jgi:nitroimidazol reductase NimA-like FMN-containing flavoprotein (pyridoxamine 5'-phosphate oxidase superfamily)
MQKAPPISAQRAKPASEYPTTARSQLRRRRDRGSHEHTAVHAILDASPFCHVGYVIDGQPFVTPTMHWREGNHVYWHGSAASRFLRKVEGAQACLTCSLMDGYVLARSAFHHSVNYRSAMVFGAVRVLTGTDRIAAALRTFVNGLFPGRWETLRPITAEELKATTVLFMEIEEATAKVRAAPPGDGDEASFPVWAGVLPMRTVLAPAEPAPDLPPGIELPEALRALIASGRLR